MSGCVSHRIEMRSSVSYPQGMCYKTLVDAWTIDPLNPTYSMFILTFPIMRFTLWAKHNKKLRIRTDHKKSIYKTISILKWSFSLRISLGAVLSPFLGLMWNNTVLTYVLSGSEAVLGYPDPDPSVPSQSTMDLETKTATGFWVLMTHYVRKRASPLAFLGKRQHILDIKKYDCKLNLVLVS